jgi:2-phosphosulfolactate phosphatase
MQVHVTSPSFDKRNFKTAVLVDVFRSSSTIITALTNGATAVIPFTNIRKAIKVHNANKHKTVLAGERNGMTPSSFHYNISPSDMTKENIGGKTVLYSSTNLTRILGRLRKRSVVVIGGIINAEAVADFLMGLDRDTAIVACGTREGPAIEDLVGAGAIASAMKDVDLSDEALAAVGLYKSASWQHLTRKGRTAKRLMSLEFERDVEFCLSPNVSSVVPGLIGNNIINLRGAD